MKYAGIISDDFVNGVGVCTSFWTQGCPYHCSGCHNPQTWDFDAGLEDSEENIIYSILTALRNNKVHRNLSILGGEPLCSQNKAFVSKLISISKLMFPDIKIYLWTGNIFEKVAGLSKYDADYDNIINNIDIMVDGNFVESLRDITLKWRGSSNQRVINVKESIENGSVVLWHD